MSESRCAECDGEVWWNPAAYEYVHTDRGRDNWRDGHQAWVRTGTYLDDPEMAEAHRRSAAGERW